MPIFGSDEKKKKIEALKRQVNNLQKQNQNLTNQIKKYEGQFEDVKEMKNIIDRLKSENQNLVNKLENFVVERQQMKETIEELKKNLRTKREQIEMKTFAINSEETDVHVSKGVTINGGINTKKNVVIEDEAEINGDIKASGNITMGDEVHVMGFIEANSVKMGDTVTVEDSVRGKGDISTGAGCTLNLVMSEGDLTLGNGTEIVKAVGGKVTLGNGVVVKDGIEYSNTMKIGSNVTVHGEIKTRP